MVEYNPQAAPPMVGGDPNLLQLSQWAQRELNQLSQQLTNSDTAQYNVQYVAPDRPRDGMTVFADGTRWNPGFGRGLYVYSNGNWFKLIDNSSGAGLYQPLPAGLLVIPSFSVHKNGTNQTGVGSVYTTITWPFEVYDIGSFFASSAWTPPAGKISLSGNFIMDGTIAVGSNAGAAIFKNGVGFKQVNTTALTNSAAAHIMIEDVANGTDFYTLAALGTLSSGTGTIRGAATDTWFMGHWIGP